MRINEPLVPCSPIVKCLIQIAVLDLHANHISDHLNLTLLICANPFGAMFSEPASLRAAPLSIFAFQRGTFDITRQAKNVTNYVE